MKGFLTILVLALIGVVAYLWLTPVVPEGKILVERSFIDSLKKIALTPPDTIIQYDTIYRKAKETAQTHPTPTDTSSRVYEFKDSLKTSDIHVFLTDSISRRGEVKYRNWRWSILSPRYIVKEISVSRPVPLPYAVERKVYFKYYGQVGYNFIQGGITGEVGIVRNRIMIGAEGGKNFAAVKIGVLF